MMKTAIKKLVEGQNLTVSEAQAALDTIFAGEATPAQVGSFLTALRMKGETLDEIIGCANAMQANAEHISPDLPVYIDLVGTGGDGTNTFNISSTAAIITAAAGVPVAKHGNRAVSSKSGSADVLEALGVNIMLEPPLVQKCVEQVGLGFMFARVFHKKMVHVSQARADLSIRTIFNILGPLSNPSGAKHALIGVFSPQMCETFAGAMLGMGVSNALVVSGHDGMDEITTTTETTVAEISEGAIKTYTLSPEQFGLKRTAPEELLGGTAEENARFTLAILSGEKGAKYDAAILSAAAGIYIGKGAASISEGVELARQAVESGRAMAKLEELKIFSNGVTA